MIFHSHETEPASTLPWWTWVAPFFIANLGTWLSISFKTDPGASLWYLPTAFGIVMAYWWGPRVLLGVYLNAVVCAPLWDLPWQRSLLYALPETLEVGLSWFLFIKIARGKPWLPDLRNVGVFLMFGSLAPTILANVYLATQLYLLGDIPQNAIWDNWRILFSADMATQYALAAPALILFTKSMSEKGWIQSKEKFSRIPFLPASQNLFFDIVFIAAIFITALILVMLFSIHNVWVLYGFMMILLAILYGVNIAVIGASWIGLLTFLLPIILTGRLGLPTASYGDFITTNFDILFLCGVTLATGRAISDLYMEINERKHIEESLSARERFLGLLNDMTRAILLSKDFDSTLKTLSVDMTKLLNADDCYITGWDAARKRVIPLVTTAKLEVPFSESSIPENETTMTQSVLLAGRALAADDVFNSPYISPNIARQYPMRSILGIPLIAGEHQLGAAIVAFKAPHQFTSKEIEHAEQAGNQIALALWNFQQSLEIQQRLKESDALAEIGRVLSETERVGTGRVLQLIVDSARDLIPQAEESVIHLLDSEERVLMAQAVSGIHETERENPRVKMQLGEGIAGQVIHEGVTINVGDINTHPGFMLKDSAPRFRSLLVAPVQSAGKQIGTISVQSKTVNAFSLKEAELLNALGVQAAIAIENTRLFESAQQRLKEVNALYQTGQRLAASLDADELIGDVVRMLQQNFGYYQVQLFLLDPETGDLVLKRGSGEIGARLVEQGFRLSRGLGIVGHVAETAEPFVAGNVNAVVFHFRNPLLPNTQSELAVPIMVEGNVVGVLDTQHTPPLQLTEGDLQLMIAVADQLAAALQKASLYSNLQNALQQEQTIRSQLIQSERLALVGRLLASVSHELNNPLQAIQNALFLLKDEENLSLQGKQDLEVILSEAERMAALIERLRNAYRPVRIQDFQPVDLNNLIEDVHALIATHMRQKEIAFEFFPDPDLPNVSGASDQLRQVALNLFLNAVDVMKPGGRLTVETRGLIRQNEVLLTVKDTGPGIDPEILPRIFDPFITSKRTGTGIGLTITQDIIQQHHGRIEAAGNSNKGAVFNVWLPIEETE